MPMNQNSGYGRALMDLVAGTVPAFGNVFIVEPNADSSDPNFANIQNVFNQNYGNTVAVYSTLAEAYAACTSNNNDVIVLNGHTTHSLSAGVDWTKSRVHMIGFDGGPERLQQQGAKVELATAATSSYVIKVTGIRNSFHHIKFINSSTNAAALTVLTEGGEGSLYNHCSFVFGVVTNLGGTTAHEVLAGSDTATYNCCVFGNDTLLTSGARSVFHIDQVTTSQEFKSNILKECIFLISSSSSTATFVRLDAVGDVLFSNTFIDCVFVASVDSAGGAAIAEASQTGTSTVKGCLNYVRPAVFNVTDFSTATSGRNAATQVVAAVSVAAAIEGIKPTA